MKAKDEFVGRIREIRRDLYGDDGIKALAGALGIPPDTWGNYERGVTMPAKILLEFLVLTYADPGWLLTGEGERLTSESYPFRYETVRQSRTLDR